MGNRCYAGVIGVSDLWENSMVAQCLGLCTLTASSPASIPGLGTKTPQALGHGLKKKEERKIVCNICLIFWFQHFMFCVMLWLHRFLISKETQMWCACDIETFRKYIFGLHPQFLAHRFMSSWNLLIDKRYGSFFVHLLSVLSPWKHFRASPETWGSHFVLGGHVCIVCSDTIFFFFFCLRRDLNAWVNVRLHRTLDWPCPGSRWTRGDELSPSLLTGCGNNAGQAGTGEGQDPQGCAAHLQSGWCPAKVKLGRSKNKKQAVLVRTWGKGTLGHCWWECELVRPLWGTLCRFLKTKNRTSSTFTLGL